MTVHGLTLVAGILDGTTNDEWSLLYTYEDPGTYSATVTVTDATDQTASDTTGEFTVSNSETTGEGTANTASETPIKTIEEEGGAYGEQSPAETTTGEEGNILFMNGHVDSELLLVKQSDAPYPFS